MPDYFGQQVQMLENFRNRRREDGNIFTGIAKSIADKKAQEQALASLMKVEEMKAQIKQKYTTKDPMNQLLNVAKLSQAFDMTVPEFLKAFGGMQQGGMKQGTQQPSQQLKPPSNAITNPAFNVKPTSGVSSTAMQNIQQPQSNLEVESYKQGAFGLVPEKYTDVGAQGRVLEEKEKAKSKVKLGEKIKTGKLVNRSNLDLIAKEAYDLTNVYVDAVEEGGAGGIIQKGISETASTFGDLPKFLGGKEIGGKFSRSGSFEGKRRELLLKMMPMLTQQAMKPEGSMRIITSVLDSLGKTIPELNTAPRTAKSQLQETLLSFYRFANAAESVGLEFDKMFKGVDVNSIGEEKISGWIQAVNRMASDIEIVGEEEEAMQGLFDKSLSRFDEVIPGASQQNEEAEYNKLRDSGMSAKEAKAKLGL